MKVKSNELRDITIEGINFIPSDKGVEVPSDKIAKLKDNFFFKHYVSIKAFEVIEDKKESSAEDAKKANAEEKARLQAELTEMGIEFNGQLGVAKLQIILDEAKAKID